MLGTTSVGGAAGPRPADGLTGEDDGMVIFDAPDADTAAALSLLVNSTGAFRSLRTHQLIPSSDLPGVLSKAAAGRASYVRPGD